MSCYKFPLVVLATQNVRSIFPSIWMYPMHIHYQSTPAWNQQKYNFVQSKSRIDVCWPLLNGFYPTIFAATCCRNRQVQSCITIMTHITSPTQGLYIGYDSISVLSQSVSLLQAYLLLELWSSSLLAGTGGNRRRPAATGPLVFSVVRLDGINPGL